MKLLKVCFDHLSMFEDGLFEIDLFASDRVTASDESAFELADHLYVNSVVALAGINATGKTTALNLLELACARRRAPINVPRRVRRPVQAQVRHMARRSSLLARVGAADCRRRRRRSRADVLR